MQTPTLDPSAHRDPRACRCTDDLVCARCFAVVSKAAAEEDLRRWLRAFGTAPDPQAPKRS